MSSRATALLADAGVPMLFVTLPLMLIALIPIVALEAYVIRRMTNANWRGATGASLFSNLVSTLVGIPVTWLLLLGLELLATRALPKTLSGRGYDVFSVTLGAPWFAAEDNDYWWMIPTAQLVLLVPFFFTSYFVERWITASWLKATASKEVAYRATWVANCWSYGGLAVFVVLVLALSYLGYIT
jgi:hypothetical protein